MLYLDILLPVKQTCRWCNDPSGGVYFSFGNSEQVDLVYWPHTDHHIHAPTTYRSHTGRLYWSHANQINLFTITFSFSSLLFSKFSFQMKGYSWLGIAGQFAHSIEYCTNKQGYLFSRHSKPEVTLPWHWWLLLFATWVRCFQSLCWYRGWLQSREHLWTHSSCLSSCFSLSCCPCW